MPFSISHPALDQYQPSALWLILLVYMSRADTGCDVKEGMIYYTSILHVLHA